MIDIRRLKESDLAECIHLGARYHEESGYSVIDYSPDRCFAFGMDALKNDDVLWIVAVTEVGKIIGMLGATVERPYFSNDKIASDFLVYVAPEWRGSTAFMRMINRYKNWAINGHRVKLLYLSVSAGLQIDKIDNVYQLLGFKKVGGCYCCQGV